MAKIRVLRILEYEFDSPELAEQHISKFGIPATGTKTYGTVRDGYTTIRSAVIYDLNPDPEGKGFNVGYFDLKEKVDES